MRSRGEIRIWREENQFNLECVEFEIIECGLYGDIQEVFGKVGLGF